MAEEVAQRRSRPRALVERETREPIKGVRKMMAAAMSQSAFTSPHVTEWITVDVTAAMQLVAPAQEAPGVPRRQGQPAARPGPRRHPRDEAHAGDQLLLGRGRAGGRPQALRQPRHRGRHAARPGGAQRQGRRRPLADRAGRRARRAHRHRARREDASPPEMAGGTFTITNVGVFGVDAGTPIINPGESAILCFGAINKRPWVDEESGEIVVRDVTTLALSFDHRHVDGEKGSRFLADVAGMLSDPGTALLF